MSDIPEQIQKLEKEAHKNEININRIVHYYRDKYSDQPLLHLIQDINERIGVYSNILEEIKKIPGPEFQEDQQATNIKLKYERLRLVPVGNLPNPTAGSIVRYVLDKIAAFARGLVKIMAEHASDLRKEIQIEPSVAIHFEVELSWKPTFTIGIEAEGTTKHS